VAQDITPEEEATRKNMSRIYKNQEHNQTGYDDWGKFTAHVVHSQRNEIDRLRTLCQQKGVDPSAWNDPFSTN
jgi:hypothetical protein